MSDETNIDDPNRWTVEEEAESTPGAEQEVPAAMKVWLAEYTNRSLPTLPEDVRRQVGQRLREEMASASPSEPHAVDVLPGDSPQATRSVGRRSKVLRFLLAAALGVGVWALSRVDWQTDRQTDAPRVGQSTEQAPELEEVLTSDPAIEEEEEEQPAQVPTVDDGRRVDALPTLASVEANTLDGIHGSLWLETLDESLQSVVVVLRYATPPERPGQATEGTLEQAIAAEAAWGGLEQTTHCGGRILLEVDAASIRIANRHSGPRYPFGVPFDVPPERLELGRVYAVHLCGRDHDGRLVPAEDGWGTIVQYPEWHHAPRIETPSGSTRLEGEGQLIESITETPAGAMRGWARLTGSTSLRGPLVELELEGTRRVLLPASIPVRVGPGTYRAAEELAIGDHVLRLDRSSRAEWVAPVRVVQRRVFARPDSDAEVEVAVTENDAPFFLNGLVVRTLMHAPVAGGSGPPIFANPSRALGTSSASSAFVTDQGIRVSTESWDCDINATIEVDDLGVLDGFTAVDVGFVRHEGMAGAPMDVDCEALTFRGDASVPTSLLRALPAQSGMPRRLTLNLSVSANETDLTACEADFAVLACRRDGQGRRVRAEGGQARWVRTGPACFAAGTPVRTTRGDRAIESLRPGEWVTGWDVVGQRAVQTTVRAVIPRGERAVMAFRLSNGATIRVTAEHPLFDPDTESYRPAETFEVGARLLGPGGEVVWLEARDEDGTTEVYDLSVDAPNNYFAGGVLVHNY